MAGEGWRAAPRFTQKRRGALKPIVTMLKGLTNDQLAELTEDPAYARQLAHERTAAALRCVEGADEVAAASTTAA